MRLNDSFSSLSSSRVSKNYNINKIRLWKYFTRYLEQINFDEITSISISSSKRDNIKCFIKNFR